MSVRFATCNILFDDGKSEPRWNERSKNLVSLIEELKPDVLATQEGRKDQLLELRDLIANNYKLLDDHREWDSIKMYPCIFVKKDTIKCLESHDRWLSETPLIQHSKSFESRWPKLATIAKLVKEDQELLQPLPFILTTSPVQLAQNKLMFIGAMQNDSTKHNNGCYGRC